MTLASNELTYADIETQVRSVLPEATASFWSSDHIVNWTDEGVRDLVLRLPDDCLLNLTTIHKTNLANGEERYDLPDDFVRLKMMRVRYATGKSLLPAKLVDSSKLWSILTFGNQKPTEETPICWVFERKLYLNPTPSANQTDGLEVWYIREPLQKGATTDEPELDEAYRVLLVAYVLSRAFDRGREDLSAKYQAIYEAGIKEAWGLYHRTLQIDERK
jgi:hypothetical protein